LFKLYPLAVIFALSTLASFFFWAARTGSKDDEGPIDVGCGERALPDTEVDGPTPWWAMVFALAANGTLFASLIFGTLYLWLVAPAWPPTEIASVDIFVVGAAILLLAAAALMRRTNGLNLSGKAFMPALMATLLVDLGTLVLFSIALFALPDPTSHAHIATVAALIGYGWLHAFGGLAFGFNALLKAHHGYVSPRRSLSLRLTRLWHDYTAITGVLGVGLILLMPSLIGMLEGMR
jgi:cytochrome c oxidase subunit I+III